MYREVTQQNLVSLILVVFYSHNLLICALLDGTLKNFTVGWQASYRRFESNTTNN
jgi:hypothetical protein